MDGTLLRDAFDHHVWATVAMIDACLALPPEQLGTSAAGTYGAIRDTIRHIVDSDASYLAAFDGGPASVADPNASSAADWKVEMEAHADRWRAILAGGVDPDAVVIHRRRDGSDRHATAGIRLTQALVHGAEHRSQIATILTTLGIEPPDVDPWAYGASNGLVTEVPAPAVD